MILEVLKSVLAFSFKKKYAPLTFPHFPKPPFLFAALILPLPRKDRVFHRFSTVFDCLSLQDTREQARRFKTTDWSFQPVLFGTKSSSFDMKSCFFNNKQMCWFNNDRNWQLGKALKVESSR